MTNLSPLVENLARVRDRIAAAAKRSGRASDSVTLVAVTKYMTAEVARQLVAAGCRDLGESRPQELWTKAEALQSSPVDQVSGDQSVRWHLIGHLQRNKVERTLPLVSMIHSADSLRLLEAIHNTAETLKRRVSVLIEVNISGDATKHGFATEEIEQHLGKIAKFSAIEIRGLMTMASREGDLAQARHEFAQLRMLRDRLQQIAPSNVRLDELSMGMSGDFEVAIEEGATMVRVGSALFEGIS